jgi:hypothetical protein
MARRTASEPLSTSAALQLLVSGDSRKRLKVRGAGAAA